MKILHLETGRFFYGGPQQVIYLCNALKDLNVDNILVCPPDSEIDEIARKIGIRVINLRCGGDFDIFFGYSLWKMLRKEKPDIVHCHSRRGADFIGGRVSLLANIPAVITRRVDNLESKFLAKLRYKPFNKIIVISKNIQTVLKNTGIKKKVTCIYSAGDSDQFVKPKNFKWFYENFSVSEDNFVILSASQFIARKGHKYLLHAVANLRNKFPQIRVVIFGRGPKENEMKQLCEHLKLEDIVQFRGFCIDLDNFISCFDLLVHPATQEGLGVIVLKSAASGIPVVGFNVGGLRESVLNGKTGLLVKNRDGHALQKSIAAFINNEEFYEKSSSVAKRWVRDRFTIKTMVKKHLKVYKSILND